MEWDEWDEWELDTKGIAEEEAVLEISLKKLPKFEPGKDCILEAQLEIPNEGLKFLEEKTLRAKEEFQKLNWQPDPEDQVKMVNLLASNLMKFLSGFDCKIYAFKDFEQAAGLHPQLNDFLDETFVKDCFSKVMAANEYVEITTSLGPSYGNSLETKNFIFEVYPQPEEKGTAYILNLFKKRL